MRRCSTTLSMGLILSGSTLIAATGCNTYSPPMTETSELAALGPSPLPGLVLAELKAGNERFVAGETVNPRSDIERLRQTATSQKPFVSILTCSDSRLPVERVFDKGVGDVFVVRVAGNVAGINEIGTLEYGVGPLDTNLVVVMGLSFRGSF